MLLSHIKRLCTILPSLITATPQRIDPNSSISNSLPAQLQRTVPACAQPCLQSALNDQFPLSCTVQEGISCLCSRYSNIGESLGEVALGCIYSSCPAIDKASATYNICLGQKNAVRPTKTALTVVATKVSTTSSTPPKHTSTFTTTTQHQSIPSESAIVNSNPLFTSSTSLISPTTEPTAAPAVAGTDPGPKTMKPAQIAGLSIAAAATFIIAIGLMALSVFLRRRKERKEFMGVGDQKTRPFLPRTYSSRYSQLSPRGSSFRTPPSQFPMLPELSAQKSKESLRGSPNKSSTIKPLPRQVYPKGTVYAVPPTSTPPRVHVSDFSSIHPLLRPRAGSRNSSNSSVPVDQIGLAISAELPGKAVKLETPRPRRKAELKPQRPKSLRRSLGVPDRDSRASVLTQHTVFEEDSLPARRRSSILLPTPPVPIAPIRALQPSRPLPAFNPIGKSQRPSPARQVAQQPELFLNIPVRYSRDSPPRISPDDVQSHGSSKSKPQLAPPIKIISAYSAYKPASTAPSTSENSAIEDIDDYYFTAYQNQMPDKPLETRASPAPISRPKDSPKMVLVKPKNSASTISRRTSLASTRFRDSISSQTSFETTGTNDPTPEDEDSDKQLSDDNKLSPVAESPISNLRYPKVPRASNQLVPRSPRSPQSQKLANQLLAQAEAGTRKGSPRLPSPSALLVKRRGEREALQLESQLHMDSPNRTDVRNHMKQYRQHIRSSSVVDAWDAGPSALSSDRSKRAQSGQWPKSPAMFDADAVKPLNICAKRQSGAQMEALKSPAWVPHLTPTRQGDDLFINVSYSR